jgi:Ser/Thr protein kinase RdoA (MazF antagonist)
VVTKDGATVARGVLDGNVVTASLSRRIAGEHPRRGDVVQAEACGRALAELDLALARLDPRELPPRNDWDRDLTRLHPRVTRLSELIEELPADRREAVARVLERVQVGPELPRQIVHGDFARSNVLMVGERVTGILDLEFVCPGYRAMDLAVGRWFFGADGPAAEAFQRGYLARCELTEVELAALPGLQLLREATSLVHWYGRYLEGLTSAADVVERADRLLRLEVRS